MTSANKWRWTYEGGVAERAFHTTRLLMVTLEMVVSLLSTLNHLNSEHCHPDPCKACPLREVHDYAKFSNADKTTHFCSSFLNYKGKSIEIIDKHLLIDYSLS